MMQIRAAEPLDLNGEKPLAQGTYRDVFAWPGEPGLVVKVLRPGAVFRPGRPIRNFLKARSARHHYRFMFREYETYLEAKLAAAGRSGPLPISELYWLQQTSRGLGMVAERIRGLDDSAAMSLGSFAAKGEAASGELIEALDRFASDMISLDIPANDTNAENLLLDETGRRLRVVLVDGFGDPSPVPLKRWSRRLREGARTRRFQRIAAALGLNWDDNARRFSLP